MSKLYKYMSCPACNCSTCTRSGEVYECQACHEQWQMVTSDEKNNKQMQTGACACPDPEGCLYLTGTDKLECDFNHGTAD